jgi:hypothetical protein
MKGHFHYFGVHGNARSLALLVRQVERAWRKGLSRRGPRTPLSWKRFKDLLRLHPLPRPTIRVQLWTAL